MFSHELIEKAYSFANVEFPYWLVGCQIYFKLTQPVTMVDSMVHILSCRQIKYGIDLPCVIAIILQSASFLTPTAWYRGKTKVVSV